MWFSHNPKFEDLYNACEASMPVLGAYIMYKAKKENLGLDDYSLAQVNRAAQLLGEYLDSASISMEETESSCDVVSFPLYSMEDDLKKMKKLLEIDEVISKKEKELHERANADQKKILKLSPPKRIDLLKEKFSEITACKNCVYNMVRANGDQVLDTIEEIIYTLHQTDQDLFCMDSMLSRKIKMY
jgi:hypothetical protein